MITLTCLKFYFILSPSSATDHVKGRFATQLNHLTNIYIYIYIYIYITLNN